MGDQDRLFDTTGIGVVAGPLSFSQLQSFISCPESFRLRRIEKVPRAPQGAFIGGRSVHQAVEEAEKRGQATNRDYVTAAFYRHFDYELAQAGGPDAVHWAGRKTKEFPEGESAPWWRASGAMMVRRFCDTRAEDEALGLRLIPDSVELRVAATLPSGSLLRGYMDAFMFADSDGTAIVRDWKTGRGEFGAAKIQLATYAYLAEKALGMRAGRGEFIYLRRPEAPRRRAVVDLAPLVPLVEKMFADFEAALKAGIFMLHPSPMCATCDVAAHCAYGRTLLPDEARAPTAGV